MQKITPCLWFDTQAEEAVKFYVSIFSSKGGSPPAGRQAPGGRNSKIGKTLRYDADSAKVSGQPEGSVLTVEFQLEGQNFLALNGGPVFKFTPAISLMVDCETQEEVDHFWNALSAVTEAEQCGWLQDKYGVSWQIVPKQLNEMLGDPDPEKAKRVMQAMLQMKKLDIAGLKQAYDGDV